jgi:hypothetical protein
VEELLGENDMVQELHRHSFYYILVLEKGKGNHVIDFIPYPVTDHSVYFMRPGQVHELVLKTGSSGFLVQFTTEYYFQNDPASAQLLRSSGKINYYRPGPIVF